MDRVVRRRPRRAGGPVEVEPLGHNEDRKRASIAARFRRLAHDRLEAGGRLRIGIGGAPCLRDAERLERAEEKGVLSSLDIMPMKRPKRSRAANVSAVASTAPSKVKKLSRKRWSWIR